ncbi:hypothetical protein [Haloferula sargassicola]|uniref:Uncharacterized protein n=1 Tax=Haloferula sargassicola TaxID=490096 RepID=A0ABP9UMB6_9BACT
MAFYLTQATALPDGMWQPGELTKVRLAGPDGPIARHIMDMPDTPNGEWNLEAADLIAAVRRGSPAEGKTELLLWDAGDPDTCPSRVIRICGISREFDTELLVHMEVLKKNGEGLKPTGCNSGEALRLLGGRVTPKAKWLWAAPKMSIGSTIVGPETAVG